MISDPLILDAMNSDVSRLLSLVYIDWPTAPVYLHTRVGEKYWDGQIWTGVGSLGSIDAATTGSQQGQINLVLNTVDLAVVNEAIKDDAVGREVKVYLACTDENRRIIAAELIIYRLIGDVNSETGNVHRIQLATEGARARFRSAKTYQRYSPKAWRKTHPNDSYCDDVEALAASGLSNSSGSHAVGSGPSSSKEQYRKVK